MFDRRRQYREPTVDRRRTYVDIVERVLGGESLPDRPRQRGRFLRRVRIGHGTVGKTVTAVEVRVLGWQ